MKKSLLVVWIPNFSGTTSTGVTSFKKLRAIAIKMAFIKWRIILIFTYTSITTCTDSKWWFDIISLEKLMQQDPRIVYKKCFDAISFDYKPFPLSINQSAHPASGFFKESFILNIPQARIYSDYGFVLVNNQFIDEMIWKNVQKNLALVPIIKENKIIKVCGRVAVIAQPAYTNYFHWLTEVLCRLALLELHGVNFDWLYVSQRSHFMRETLALWGIPKEKIIDPRSSTYCIQADELILPSLVANTNHGTILFTCYAQPHLLDYVKNKLLTAALAQNVAQSTSKRIFISRKDSAIRSIINEDAVFELFQKHGFERYKLSHLSVAQQILLFHNAEIIVSAQGTGLANSIFCTEKTKIIELFQKLNDCTFWYLAQTLHLNYTPIKTTEFIPDYLTAYKSATYMPLPIIHYVINSLCT